MVPHTLMEQFLRAGMPVTFALTNTLPLKSPTTFLVKWLLLCCVPGLPHLVPLFVLSVDLARKSPFWECNQLRSVRGFYSKLTISASGGLGHFGILWAKALGAEVYAISHTANKKDDALKLGAKEFILTDKENWAESWAFTFDFILNTADMTNEFNLKDYMSTLAVNGCFHNVGLPDKPLPQMMAQDFAPNGSTIGGSHIGSRPEMEQMLKLASDKKLQPMIQTIDISEKGCKEAVEKVKVNNVRYRFTLTNFDAAFGKRE